MRGGTSDQRLSSTLYRHAPRNAALRVANRRLYRSLSDSQSASVEGIYCRPRWGRKRQMETGGGQGNGKPGLRSNYDPHYYAAFLIDPDGHRIEAVTKVPSK